MTRIQSCYNSVRWLTFAAMATGLFSPLWWMVTRWGRGVWPEQNRRNKLLNWIYNLTQPSDVDNRIVIRFDTKVWHTGVAQTAQLLHLNYVVSSDPVSSDTGVWTRFIRLPPPPLGFSPLMATPSLLPNEMPVFGLTDQPESVTRTQSWGICSLITMEGRGAVRVEFCQESGQIV